MRTAIFHVGEERTISNPIVFGPKEKKVKVMIVGVDHGLWEDYFNDNIETIWQPNFFMYNESVYPTDFYEEKQVEGFTEELVFAYAAMAIAGIIAITNRDMTVVLSRMELHGFRPQDYPSLNDLGKLLLNLNDLNKSFYYADEALHEFEEKNGLSHCGSERLLAVYENIEEPMEMEEKAAELVKYTYSQLRREFSLQRHYFSLALMILIETIGNTGTEMGQLVKSLFGGIDFTEFDVDLSWEDLDKFNVFRDEVRDKEVLDRLRDVFSENKYDAYVLVMGNGHVPHFVSLLEWQEGAFEDLALHRDIEANAITVDASEYDNIDEAKEIMIPAMEDISEFLIGPSVFVSTPPK